MSEEEKLLAGVGKSPWWNITSTLYHTTFIVFFILLERIQKK
jgi:hypothetical protein